MGADLEGVSLMRVSTRASDRVGRHDFASAIVQAARDAGEHGVKEPPRSQPSWALSRAAEAAHASRDTSIRAAGMACCGSRTRDMEVPG